MVAYTPALPRSGQHYFVVHFVERPWKRDTYVQRCIHPKTAYAGGWVNVLVRVCVGGGGGGLTLLRWRL